MKRRASFHHRSRAPVAADVRPWVNDHPLNNFRVTWHHVFREQRGQLRSPRSEHWPGAITVGATTGRLRPPRTSWQRFFTARSTSPLMHFRTVSVGDSPVCLRAARVRRFSRSGALLPSWSASFSVAARFVCARGARKLSAVGGQPNFSWCGRAGSVVPFLGTTAARRTARRYSA